MPDKRDMKGPRTSSTGIVVDKGRHLLPIPSLQTALAVSVDLQQARDLAKQLTSSRPDNEIRRRVGNRAIKYFLNNSRERSHKSFGSGSEQQSHKSDDIPTVLTERSNESKPTKVN